MKLAEQQRAVQLRREGMTYSEIQHALNVSKSSVSLWLQHVPYVPRADTLVRRRMASIRNRHVLRERKLVRISQIKAAADREMQDVPIEAMKWMGLMAYWCEGSKTVDHIVKFTNTDPHLICLMVRWLPQICDVPLSKIRCHLRIHPDVVSASAQEYWSHLTGIPHSQFYRSTQKKSESKGKKVRRLRYGIASIIVCDTSLFHRIRAWTEVISREFCKPVNEGTGCSSAW